MRCLLIEDDPAAAQLIQDGLQREGFSVTACHDGASGLSRVDEAGWDVIVLDRMLPGALGGLNERVRGLRGGGDDYLTKPFAFDELLARIEALIGAPRSYAQAARRSSAQAPSNGGMAASRASCHAANFQPISTTIAWAHLTATSATSAR